jgi:lysyl-tRNA synthetase class I
MKPKTKKNLKKVWNTTKKVGKAIKKNIDENIASQYYEINVFCFNCNFIGKTKIEKGKRVFEGLNLIKCPKCNCPTLMNI